MIYVLIFILTLCLFYYSRKYKRKGLLNLFWLEILAVLILSVLAGGRASGVGTDTITYVDSEFAVNLKIQDFGEFVKFHYLEVGYEFVSFVVSRFTQNVHWVYFCYGLLTYSFIYRGLKFYYKRDSRNLMASVLIFLLVYYNSTYNAVRQSIAIAILFGASRYLLERKPLRFFAFVCLAMTFHSSAIIGLIIYILYWWIKDIEHNENKLVILLGLIVIGFFIFPIVCKVGMNVGILPARFARYFGENAVDKGGPGLALSKLPFLLYGLIAYRKINDKIKPFVVFAFIDFLLALLKLNFGAAARLCDYFGIFDIVMLPNAMSAYPRRYRKIAKYLLLFMLIFYWVYCILIKNYGQTIPYRWSWNM